MGVLPNTSLAKNVPTASPGKASAQQEVSRYLEQQVRRYATSIGSQDYQISLQPLAKLPRCDQPLHQALSEPTQPVGRLSVTLECHQPNYWKARVKAEVAIFLPLVVAKHPLSRKQTITQADLSLKRSNLAYLRHGYFTDINAVAGLKSRRKITAGKVISPRMVEAPQLVQRNEEVIIEARMGSMTAKMKGVALESGAMGDSIRVRNLSSNKEIFATVTGRQRVQTTF
ncbi:flagellar basal body P-ring formation protein FlgA [Photobacterium sp. SDRW27]|uniref:flagellar basal body P-ring formation chaperone FlgA n=1 Tax=Photobacterium obscurum TaxID=2829490 RepID=UPI002243501B|nr:flagellar basal body P-ring formation chaperone FlgA [Photobacterium obscurum]MCW8330699.1 flagellar basal body P-ring formation protein FlgA [Photobacterium obscurum]